MRIMRDTEVHLNLRSFTIYSFTLSLNHSFIHSTSLQPLWSEYIWTMLHRLGEEIKIIDSLFQKSLKSVEVGWSWGRNTGHINRFFFPMFLKHTGIDKDRHFGQGDYNTKWRVHVNRDSESGASPVKINYSVNKGIEERNIVLRVKNQPS